MRSLDRWLGGCLRSSWIREYGLFTSGSNAYLLPQTVINCIRTIYLLTSAYPSILSGTNASTLLPYLKNASTVWAGPHFFFFLNHRVLLGRGIGHFWLPPQDIQSNYPSYAEDSRKIWAGASSNFAADDNQAFCWRCSGLCFGSIMSVLHLNVLFSSYRKLSHVCVLLCNI